MRRAIIGGAVVLAAGISLFEAKEASAAWTHVVQPGESLSAVAAVNGLSPDSVAAYNGMASDAMLIEGTTIQIPAASDTTTTDTTSTGTGGDSGIAPAPGMGHIPSPWGELHLDPAAADAWNAMREEALAVYGIDLHPGGTLSAYRTYEQQGELYEAFLAGAGAPANPPGSSSHEYGTAVDLATPEMRTVIDEIGWAYGWGKVHGPDEWWHVDYVGG